MYLFHYKIDLIKLPPIAKVMVIQNFKCIYLRTMILCLCLCIALWSVGDDYGFYGLRLENVWDIMV